MSPTSTGKPAAQGSADHEILFQHWFKSVGPRTYATQLKKANNGNHYLVLTEGKRDDKTGEVRKTRLFVFSEDFVEFFRMLKETAQFVRDHPVPDSVKRKRDRFWAKNGDSPQRPAGGNPQPASHAPLISAGGKDAGPSPAARRAVPAPARRAVPAPARQAVPPSARQAVAAPSQQTVPAPARQAVPAPARQAVPATARQGTLA
ncbi:MAG TPA: DUF3276 family protein [Tepidisphaeraceae bacterium]|nr:DUF3276 family protein [Tepidisphaeraceae bacterium]